MSDSEKLNISAPWYEHCHKLDALFAGDEDVTVGEFDDESKTIKLYVRGIDKADALSRIVKPTVEFGNTTINVEVIPDNDGDPTVDETLMRAFSGNPLFSGTASLEMYGGTVTYAIFEPTVVQYWNDNIGSCFGFETKTVEEVAHDVLDVNAFICSDVKAVDTEG